MSFVADNEEFEAWLRKQCKVVEADLDCKHERMKIDAFTFLRATYFRWARRIESVCPTLAKAPAVLSVGDLHLENFGTWHDAEGRLIWGVNDFDEAAVIPYTLDLLRLATSIHLARHAHEEPIINIGDRAASKALLKGYRQGLQKPKAIVLDEKRTWMRPLVDCTPEDRGKFWKEIGKLRPQAAPHKVRKILGKSLPDGSSDLRFAPRRKGGGGLGRPRYVVQALWCGGHIVREAKALVPSAWDWAHHQRNPKSRFLDLANGEFRAPDPFLHIRDSFIVRRIAPDSRKIELDRTADLRLTPKALEAMGFDLGAIHAATKSKQAAVLEDIRSRPAGWLSEAAKVAAAAVQKDLEAWRSHRP